MNPHEPGFECPDCGVKLFNARRCAACGWKAGRDDDKRPAVSCWTCDACGVRSPGMSRVVEPDGPGGTLRGLCGGCHTSLRLRPRQSRPDDVCAAMECAGRERHTARDHMNEFRDLVAKLEARLTVTL